MAKTFDPKSEEFTINELLKEVIDPEIDINIVDLGLIYGIKYKKGESISVDMTLSTPACPLGDVIVSNAQQTIERFYKEEKVSMQLVWEPSWSPEMVTPEGKKALDMM
ncbi:MAG: metal-sulfur cluster assembly factor [Bacteroidota bacterium]